MITWLAAARAATASSIWLLVELAGGLFEVRVVGAERCFEFGVVEGEEHAAAGWSLATDRGAVFLDRRVLEFGVALETERLREPDHRRGRSPGPAGQFLRGQEGRFVEMVDDVAGDILLGTGKLVDPVLDVS